MVVGGGEEKERITGRRNANPRSHKPYNHLLYPKIDAETKTQREES